MNPNLHCSANLCDLRGATHPCRHVFFGFNDLTVAVSRHHILEFQGSKPWSPVNLAGRWALSGSSPACQSGEGETWK